MLCRATGRAWSERSEPRERRDFLGRWRVSRSSDEYLHTARSVVRQLQEELVTGVLADVSGEIKSIGLKDLELHLRQSGESDSAINQSMEILDVGFWAAHRARDFRECWTWH